MTRELTPSQVEEKRQKLVRCATNILETEGLEALTLRHLATTTNVSRSTPYLYFKDKAALIDAIKVHGLKGLIADCEEATMKPVPYLEHLRLLGETYVDFALARPQLYQLIFDSDAGEASMSIELSQTVKSYTQMTEGPMQEAYDDGMLALPPERLNPVLWAALHGLITLHASGHFGDGCDEKGGFAEMRQDMEQVLAMGFFVKPPNP